MSVALKMPPAGIADLLAIPANERFHEIIDGELVRKAMPSIRHGGAQNGLGGRLDGPYNRRLGGRRPGGWRFASETEIRFEDHQIYRPDIAGWRRERMPDLLDEFPVTLRPDWVCEIFSPSNESTTSSRRCARTSAATCRTTCGELVPAMIPKKCDRPRRARSGRWVIGMPRSSASFRIRSTTR